MTTVDTSGPGGTLAKPSTEQLAVTAGSDGWTQGPPGASAGRDETELTTAGIGEMLPGVLPPLLADLGTLLVEEALRHNLDALGTLGAPDDDLAERSALLRLVHGRATLDLARMRHAMLSIPGAEARIRRQYFGEAPTFPADTQRTPWGRVTAVQQRIRGARLRRHAMFDADVFTHAVNDVTVGADARTDAALLARQLRLIDVALRGVAAEMGVAADASAITDALRDVLTRYLSLEAATHHACNVTIPTVVPHGDPRASAAMIGGPTWDELGAMPAEHPDLRHPVDDHDRYVDALATDLDRSARWPRSGIRRWLVGRRIDRLASEAAEQLARRERTKAALLRLGGELRRSHLEMGRRLVARGCIHDIEDVELLTLAELRTGFLAGDVPGTAQLAERRAALLQNEARSPLPAHINGPSAGSPTAIEPVGTRFTGWAVSGGRFVGTARYVDGPYAELGPDEVLVAVTTDPSWAPLLMSCHALVIEQGGPLSHAAILAREFGIPAVFNIPQAVSRLAGHRIAVDGDSGIVTLLDQEDQ